jgi:hypothetical protein
MKAHGKNKSRKETIIDIIMLLVLAVAIGILVILL